MPNKNDQLLLPRNLEQIFSDLKKHLATVSRFSLPPELMRQVSQIIDYYEKGGDKVLSPDESLFRARLQEVDQRKAFSHKDVGAPPPKLARAGRVNPEGLPYLYLASTPETAIAEVRPWTGALITVAEFNATKNLRLLDFSKKAATRDFDIAARAVYSALAESFFVYRHFSAPVHRDDHLSYLPMQFITDLVKQRGYDGIRFPSLQVKKGKNTVVFNPKYAECKTVVVHGVDKIEYTTTELPTTAPVLTVGSGKFEGKDW